MPRVIFIRHGRPACRGIYQRDTAIPGDLVGSMLEDYAETGLDMSFPPPAQAIESISGAGAVLCSDLPRAVESARCLVPHIMPSANGIFREAGLPYGYFRRLKMKPEPWMAIMRICWLTGFHRNTESLAEAKCRARQGNDRIIEAVKINDTVLVAAHGFINIFMIRNLRARGWHPRHAMRYGYWGCNEMIL